MSLVEFNNVYKRYKTGEIVINAVDGISFKVEEGEFAIVVGASGAGKTTVLNILGGMDSCSEGEIIVGGKDISKFKDKHNRLILMTDEYYPRLEIIFGGHDSFREPVVIDAEEFIAVKGFKAKGKRLTTYTVETINELEPTRFPDPPQTTDDENTDEEPENLDPDNGKTENDILDEMTGQMKLF